MEQQHQQQQPQQQQQAKQQQKPKKKRPMTPEHRLLVSVQAAAKTRNPAAGVAAYHAAIAAGTSVHPDLYSTLLYLCSGGDEWELPLRQQLTESTALVRDLTQRAAADAAQQEALAAEASQQADLGSPESSATTAVGERVAAPALPMSQTAASGGNGHTPAVASCPTASSKSSPAGAELLSEDPSASTAVAGSASPAAQAVTGTDAAEAAAEAEALPQLTPAQLQKEGRAIFDQMQAQQVKPLELAYTALARMAAAAGDGDAALEATHRGLQAGVAPKLRAFTPALLAYAVQGQVEPAFQVADEVQRQKLDLTETEFALLLQACARGAASWQRVQSLLVKMTKELTRLQPETLAAAEQYFRSEAAAAEFKATGALAGKGKGWILEPCTVSESGESSSCGGQLQALDLEEEEWEQFASGIARLAEQRERKPKDFEAFKAWLEQHGPVHALVDGANVALYGQNWERGAFSFGQIKGVMDQLTRAHPDLHPLMMLHVGRTKGPASDCKLGRSLLADLTRRHSFYATPKGSNDDWYWMYAAVKAGPKGLLISNDQMRDHLFQLLAPRFFQKWKQRHQVKFTFDESGLHLHYPAVYTVCAQGLANGSYVFPAAQGNVWLSARLQPDGEQVAG
ncbi:hypothetical protein ABBQ38_012130 [Trebouxia sp. C0009 RCD-2024]